MGHWRPSTKENFISSLVVASNGCVEHPNAPGKNGYPQFGSKTNAPWKGAAHRAAWYFEHGCLPDDPKICVLHRCNNKKCVNINHLYLGTHTENADDLVRGRYSRRLALSREQVAEARAKLVAGLSLAEVARQMSVHVIVIQWLSRGVTYRYETLDGDWISRKDWMAKYSPGDSRKLNASLAAQIRERLSGGEPVKDVAAHFGVHWSTIYRIRNGEPYSCAAQQ